MIHVLLTAALAAATPTTPAPAAAPPPTRTTVSWHPDTARYCIRWSRRDTAASVMGERLYGRECRSAAKWRTLGVTFFHRNSARRAPL